MTRNLFSVIFNIIVSIWLIMLSLEIIDRSQGWPLYGYGTDTIAVYRDPLSYLGNIGWTLLILASLLIIIAIVLVIIILRIKKPATWLFALWFAFNLASAFVLLSGFIETQRWISYSNSSVIRAPNLIVLVSLVVATLSTVLSFLAVLQNDKVKAVDTK